MAAARLAGADDFIRRLSRGYDTVLAEGARSLSAGQRQKLALTRAFLRRSPVLLLDEPTAHLDPVSADRIMAALSRTRWPLHRHPRHPPAAAADRPGAGPAGSWLSTTGGSPAWMVRSSGPGWRRRHDRRESAGGAGGGDGPA